KFQVSFKYQVFNPEGELAKAFWPVAGIHVAYTQTSLWDLEADSAPFFDSSYKPELLWVMPEVQFDKGPVSRLGLQVGFEHESNGKGGADSRSLNFAYVRPSITFGDRADGWFATVAPKLQAYVIGFDQGNADITDYRGFGELSLIVGKRNGLQLRTTAWIGDDWDKGSVQLDLSYPIGPLVGKNVDLYLHAQYFNGFGESLLQYNESTSIFRVGLSIVR
ncbi:MAG TPA: phospholipase A, partial [Humisphaera sp.]